MKYEINPPTHTNTLLKNDTMATTTTMTMTMIGLGIHSKNTQKRKDQDTNSPPTGGETKTIKWPISNCQQIKIKTKNMFDR